MEFTLKRPCKGCPFRTDIKGYLHPERIDELEEGLIDRQGTFTCHQTTVTTEDDETVNGPNAQHCAGALILLEKLERPNQMMRICERFGGYDRHALDMEAPVFDSFEEMRDAQDEPCF